MSLEEFDHLKVDLQDIISATNNFDPQKKIGRGGFGSVYKGELILPKGRAMIAFKRLDPTNGQGNVEFRKEIVMLSKYRHENLVSLVCFCDEGHERILGYEFASRGSLDCYLNDTSLTWTQRINICIGVARALNYLHDPKGTQERVIHRDIKSSNILLDEQWTAKVSDFGLSKFGPANQAQTFVTSNAVGTPGYCDPLYWEMGFLTKESDAYSFGVVLFEVMCGKLCCEYRNGNLNQILVHMWKHRYDESRLDEIVWNKLKTETKWDSLLTFASIASRCLNRNRKERPTMLQIIKQLEVALRKHQRQEVITYRNNPSIISSVGKSKKREHEVDNQDKSGKRECLSKEDELAQHLLKAEIAKITDDNGGLVDVEGVEKLVQLMQAAEVNLGFRVMLVDVISVTYRPECHNRFLQLRGVKVLDEWLQEVKERKVYERSPILDEYLFSLLRALDSLPVNLNVLQSCNVGRNVNHLRSHKNHEIQKKARSLVDTWKKRVEAEMNMVETRSRTDGRKQG